MSSSSSSNTHWIYDVFLNFRGEDTRKTFVSDLYAALSNVGINTFIDEKLRKGMELRPELVRAIQGSRISIVIFSTNYASSKWCLDEIMECCRTYGQEVLPVFYGVDPSDVRYQRGDFGKGLQKCFWEATRDVFRSWESALKEAANLAGWDMRGYRNESQLLEEVVDDIIGSEDKDLLSITEFPVGLESRVEQVIEFIGDQSGTGCIVGIWGMGGLGKTTLARFIYNQIGLLFRRRSFIEINNRGHIDLQENLISDVQKTKVKIHSITMGLSIIEKTLCGERSLIVLDDVTEFDQLKAYVEIVNGLV